VTTRPGLPKAPESGLRFAFVDITTVADDLIVAHDGFVVQRLEHLAPGSVHDVGGVPVRTLVRPEGELLCRFATVNDVHFGEVEAGRLGDNPGGPIQRIPPGLAPYPETMNRGAVAEIEDIDAAAVFAKGDLSVDGRPEEWAAFEECYRRAFDDRLFAVRGNHDAYRGQVAYAGDHWVELPGVAVALMDTVIPEHTTGRLTPSQLDWLDDHAARADTPVIVMGHHQQWIGAAASRRSNDYFGLHPDPSDALAALIERRRSIVAYTAGHTHRHRRRMLDSGVPSIEIGCVKDFPGTWGEYRVYERGIMQVVHRVSSLEALQWSEQCRHLYQDFGVDYETYALGRLDDRCFTIELRH
jgi:3',5'-cyclic AMP phosphodiesterase CpdA